MRTVYRGPQLPSALRRAAGVHETSQPAKRTWRCIECGVEREAYVAKNVVRLRCVQCTSKVTGERAIEKKLREGKPLSAIEARILAARQKAGRG